MKRLPLYKHCVATAATIVWLLAAGCLPAEDTSETQGSGGSTTTPTGTGGGGAAGGQGHGGSGAGSSGCNALVNDGPEVAIIQVAEAMPSPTGGKLELGSYQLTGATLFTGPGGATGPTGARQKEHAEYGDDEVQIVVDLFQGDDEQHFTLHFEIADAGVISFQGTCPGPLNFPYDRYSAPSPDTLSLYSTSMQQELTYTRSN